MHWTELFPEPVREFLDTPLGLGVALLVGAVAVWILARIAALIPRHAWRVRWLRESVAAHLGRRLVRSTCCRLGDIRVCIDDLLASADPLLIINLDRQGTFVEDRPDPLVLRRLERHLHVTSGQVEKAVASIRTAPEGSSVLVSGSFSKAAKDTRSSVCSSSISSHRRSRPRYPSGSGGAASSVWAST